MSLFDDMCGHVESDGCWCDPELLQRCPECDEHDEPPEDCWRCAGRGLVPKFDENLPTLTVHKDITL